MKRFSGCDQFLAFSGQIEMIVYTGQTVRVHIWVIDRDKQGENTKA